MEEIRKSAKTVDDAIAAALAELGACSLSDSMMGLCL